ncbi:MAG: DUF1232 domain-containing protein [Spirochaetales bacterium]|nr:DUF1232 domain-containing protein [Spirochaetales bacterium]
MMFFKKKKKTPVSKPQIQTLDEQSIERELQKKEGQARFVLNDPRAWQDFFTNVSLKFQKHFKVFDPVVDDVKLLFHLVQDIYKKRYTDFPLVSVISVVASLVYFLSPFDLLPDFLPFLGFTDDISVLIFVITNIKTDLDKYRKWLSDHSAESESMKVDKSKKK